MRVCVASDLTEDRDHLIRSAKFITYNIQNLIWIILVIFKVFEWFHTYAQSCINIYVIYVYICKARFIHYLISKRWGYEDTERRMYVCLHVYIYISVHNTYV